MFQNPTSRDVDQFILEEIESVPHLEALLLLWRNAPQPAGPDQIAHDLYIPLNHASGILDDLQRRGLISRAVAGGQQLFFYETGSEAQNRLIQAVDATYRRELIRVSSMIHSKPSAGLRAFADAFRFRKDRD